MKKIILILILAVSLSNINAFAASGFEAILNVPLGLSAGIPVGTYSDVESIKGKAGFDSGITAQLGYMIGLGKIGISILGELGYSYDSYRYYSKENFGSLASYEYTSGLHTHSFQIGLLPKVNIGAFAVGVGFGVKIPVSGYITSKMEGSIAGVEGSTSSDKISLNRDDFENYDRNVIPYIKATFDYSFFFTSKIALNVGAYLGYDFGLASKSPIDGEYTGIDSFDIGLQLGLRFAPKL
ncbi:hypothetical protein Q5M87_08160 [Brachyspira innocens]|uniref:PorT family protein n=1 Tax=Brachyspira innocens TaxID=13264 RepID=A0ABT8YVL4_9SPIR|nr:hypothetical protein [Brachyspira innocens]MDO6993982.1 hypothetical protein [Brachyspira innocens]MDO7019958.1 hypothetical protein [Brachyspira innocens]